MTQRPICECGCGTTTAGGRFIPGHNIVAMYAARDTSTLFWNRVERRSVDECWPWIAKAKTRFGYGAVRWKGATVTAHRVAYELTYGPIPCGMSVRHGCDNPPCCNPAHLSLGSQSDNVNDAKQRSRFPKGQAHHWSSRIEFRGRTLSIRDWAKETGLSYSALAHRFNRGWTIERALTEPLKK